MKKATCVYIIDSVAKDVLMARKTRKVGIGYWFGYGGKREGDESPEECTLRETKKETNGIELDESQLERVAVIDFYKGETFIFGKPGFRVIFYRTFQLVDRIVDETEEMADPTWFSIDDLPFDQMMPGDKFFIPEVLAGIPVRGWIHFSDDEKTVFDHSVDRCLPEDLVF